ncbi:hypothetical protein AURDEDRAFT_160617 [Auricularia subglabra TFB-10046 SS5]|nr:hypothetical protein AURDEDRAFT_160617 [Auricularia subglabra TFB-10046 SS5]
MPVMVSEKDNTARSCNAFDGAHKDAAAVLFSIGLCSGHAADGSPPALYPRPPPMDALATLTSGWLDPTRQEQDHRRWSATEVLSLCIRIARPGAVSIRDCCPARGADAVLLPSAGFHGGGDTALMRPRTVDATHPGVYQTRKARRELAPVQIA